MSRKCPRSSGEGRKLLVDNIKPTGGKNYGHIPHLPGSRMGPGDHKCHEGQLRIATQKKRDKHDRIIVQEKVDGSNVGVARLNGQIYPIGRAGYLACSSPYEQHRHFYNWAFTQQDRFMSVLQDGERICGEWLAQAHGTMYHLEHEPFVAFDIMRGQSRMVLDELLNRIAGYDFITPRLISRGEPFGIEPMLEAIKISGHGAIDPVEGAVWRVERDELIHPGKGSERRWVVDFLVKYVRPEKIDGAYLPEVSGKDAVWNWRPIQYHDPH